jgi:hypothetical protein
MRSVCDCTSEATFAEACYRMGDQKLYRVSPCFEKHVKPLVWTSTSELKSSDPSLLRTGAMLILKRFFTIHINLSLDALYLLKETASKSVE